MKIRRFFAPDSRKALRMVQAELGEDAIIISNRSVDGGVEILAAEDFDEELSKRGELDTSEASFVAAAPKATAPVAETPANATTYSPEAAMLRALADEKSAVQATTPGIEAAQGAMSSPAAEILIEKPAAGSARETNPGKADPIEEEQVMTSQAILNTLVERKAARKAKRDTDAEQDALITDMREEISKLRDLMESQLSALNLGNWANTSPARSNLIKHFTRMGFSPTLSTRLIGKMENLEGLTPQVATREALAMLTREIKTTGDQIFTKAGTIVLIGPAGAGKTTSIAKIASQYIRLHGNKHVILVSADNTRIGAHEQLMAFGRLLDVPVLRARDSAELKQILAAMADKALVLVDTGSLTQEDLRNPRKLPTIAAMIPGTEHYLVLPATNQTATLERITKAVSSIDIKGAIITKTDEATNLGGALTSTINQDLPVAYWTDGQKITQPLHVATPKHLVAKTVTMINKQDEPAIPRPQNPLGGPSAQGQQL
ncbi:MAG: flagellar biosynthesis protein FlhF [Thiotrichales bacterium]